MKAQHSNRATFTATALLGLVAIVAIGCSGSSTAPTPAPATYSVTYDGNGSSGGSAPVDAAKYTAGSTVTVLGNTGTLVKTGFDFSGWNTLADHTGTAHAPAATFAMGSANVTLYAAWLQWWSGTKQLGVAGAATSGNSVTTDASGNVYVTGLTNGGLDGNTKTGTNDCFLTKYDSSGTKLYTKQLGVAGGATQGISVAADASGNVYVVGWTDGGLDGNTKIGTRDVFFTKYNSSGTKLYTKQLGATGGFTQSYSGAIDASGNLYVTGLTTGGLDGITRTGTVDFFLTKYDSSGTKLYTKQLGVAGATTEGHSVATDASGNVYVTGWTNGGLDGNTKTGTSDFFLTKFDSSGTKLYTKQLGVAGAATQGNSVATDASGSAYVTGWTMGGLDGNTKTGSNDFFLTKFDSSGMKLYTKQLGVSGVVALGYSVATDASSNVFVTGYTMGGLDGNTLAGTDDFFLTKYDSSGAKLYTKQLGVAGAATIGVSVTAKASGNVYVTGSTAGGLDGNTKTGTTDFFLTKYNGSGVKQ